MSVPGRRLKSYAEIGELATARCGWPKVGYAVAVFGQVGVLYGSATIYLVLAGQYLSEIVPELTVHDWILILGVCLMPFTWLRVSQC